MPTCFDVANYFLSKVRPEVGDFMSHLKLQKLVYYAQGFSLAILNTPLFNDPIEAWDHGPVTPNLYHHFKQYEANPIPPIPAGDVDEVFTIQQKQILDEVYVVYGQFSAWMLRNMTHDEEPWQNAVESPITTITHDSMRNFFASRVYNSQI